MKGISSKGGMPIYLALVYGEMLKVCNAVVGQR